MCVLFRERKARLRVAEREIKALKGAIRQVALTALTANSSDEDHLKASATPDCSHKSTDVTTPADSSTRTITTNGAAVNGSTVETVKPCVSKASNSNGSDKAAKMKDRKASRSSARAHNGAHPSEDVLLRGNGSNMPGRKWPLGVTWPFTSRKGSRKSVMHDSAAAAAVSETAAAATVVSDTPSATAKDTAPPASSPIDTSTKGESSSSTNEAGETTTQDDDYII